MGRKTFKKIPAEILHGAQTKLDEVMGLLKPYLVTLTQQERQALVKMETESIKFLEVSHGIALENSELFPTFIKAAVFREEFSAAHELWLVANKVSQLNENINDTGMLAGNNAMETALIFYQTVKIAALHDIPGARVIYEELKPAFRSRKRSRRKVKLSKTETQPELFERHELTGPARNP